MTGTFMSTAKSERPENTNDSDPAVDSSSTASQSPCSGSLLKGVALIIAGSALLALTMNTLRSSKAIDLSRNYFPILNTPAQPSQQQESASSNADNNLNDTGAQQDLAPAVEGQLVDDGIQRLTFEDVRDHFMTAEEELMSTGESIVAFVDARVRDQYEDGHIPGALWLYHYESGDLIDDLRPQLEMAFFIIVYCNGGDCEDSLHLAADLGSLYGLPPENVYVYEGGFNEWKDNEMPVKTGSEAR